LYSSALDFIVQIFLCIGAAYGDSISLSCDCREYFLIKLQQLGVVMVLHSSEVAIQSNILSDFTKQHDSVSSTSRKKPTSPKATKI